MTDGKSKYFEMAVAFHASQNAAKEEAPSPSDAAACSLDSAPETSALMLAMGQAVAEGKRRPPIWELMAKLENERNYYRQEMQAGNVNGRRVAEERDRLQDAIRNLRVVKGRHNTQIAMDRLIDLLPENDLNPTSGKTH